MPNHPRIPPNCPHFFENPDGVFFVFAPEAGEDSFALVRQTSAYMMLLVRAMPGWRPVIAAVAEVAWTKETEIRVAAYHKAVSGMGFGTDEAHMEELQRLWSHPGEAKQNALAWRAWGEEARESVSPPAHRPTD